MQKTFFKKIIASLLLTTLFVNIFSFALISNPKKAQAADLSGLGSIGGAAVGCAINSLLSGGSLFGSVQDDSSGADSQSVPTKDQKVKEKTSALEKKESCLDGIITAGAKTLLKKITQSTVEWINGGFRGEPLFIKNPGSFFKSIADQEIMGITTFIGDVKNEALYPFGRDIAKNLILSTQRTFEQNAAYTLAKVVAEDDLVTFTGGISGNGDFSAGGWDGWLAMTQLPQNNPVGANFQASNELSIRLQGTYNAPANEIRQRLQQAKGFLGLDECKDPEGYQYAGYGVDECKRYETHTPGEVIANQLDISLGTSQRQLELADEVSESLAAVFDALINQLFQKGLASLSGDTSGSNVGVYGGYGNNSSTSSLGITTGGAGSVNDPNQWYNQNPNFNIWQDLQPIIDDQIYYKALLADYPYIDRKGMQQTGGENYLILNKVAPAIYELDFCEPGPNPIWYGLANDRTQEFINGIPQNAQAIAGWAKTLAGFSQSGIVGLIIGAFAGSDAEKLGHVIRQGVETFYNIKAEEDLAVQQPSTIASMAQSLLEQYKTAIEEKYNGSVMPSSNYGAVSEYKKIPGYLKAVERNKDSIELTDGLIRRLQFIKQKIDLIPEPTLTNGITLTPAQNEEVSSYLRSIGRMAPDLANAETIQTMEDDIFQLNDAYNYIAHPTDGLIKACQDELRSGVYDSIKMLRFPYPTTLIPVQIQDIYKNDPTLGGVLERLNPSGDNLEGPTYLPNRWFGFKDGYQNASQPELYPVRYTHFLNMHSQTNMARMEEYFGIY